MGVFDFFSKKNKRKQRPAEAQNPPQPEHSQEQNHAQPHTPRNEQGEYLGDLEKTAQIEQLFQRPQEERDEAWVLEFYRAAADASFKCIAPQVVQGPDGFPYVKLELPTPGERFQCYVLRHMMDDFLLDKGLGVVIIGADQQPLWVFSYGDILNLHLHGAFEATHPIFTPKRHDETLQGERKVWQGEPAQDILPACARNAIAAMLKRFYDEPRLTLLYHAEEENYELAFNATPDKFADMDTFRAVLQQIGWFLPRYYAYCAAEENEGSFCLLEKHS